MPSDERVTGGLQGHYRDVIRDPAGRVTWDSGWRKNAIVDDCRRLLASFMRKAPGAFGIQGLQVGMGQASWDAPPGPPPATATQTALVDPSPFTVPLVDPDPSSPPVTDLQIDFLLGGTVTSTPTSRIQVVAQLGPGAPPWPDADHPTRTLREFGLVGELDGAGVLINYVTHPAITKDPFSTLTRTIWLVF